MWDNLLLLLFAAAHSETWHVNIILSIHYRRATAFSPYKAVPFSKAVIKITSDGPDSEDDIEEDSGEGEEQEKDEHSKQEEMEKKAAVLLEERVPAHRRKHIETPGQRKYNLRSTPRR